MIEKYFKGTVVDVQKTETLVTTKVMIGPWWKRCIETKNEIEVKWYAICELLGTDFQWKVLIQDDDIDRIKAGQRVDLMLAVQFKFSCFHYPREEKKEVVVV